jgi:hypothetical protein
MDECQDLIARGANVNAINLGESPLSVSRCVHMSKLLIAHGANVNGANHPRYKEMPLYHAIQLGDVAMCSLLITHGADVNAQSALCLAKQFDVFKLLCDHVTDMHGQIYNAWPKWISGVHLGFLHPDRMRSLHITPILIDRFMAFVSCWKDTGSSMNRMAVELPFDLVELIGMQMHATFDFMQRPHTTTTTSE